MNDSSSDSLENDMNEDVETPRHEMLKKHGQGSTDMKKNTTNEEVKKESSSDSEEQIVKLVPESEPSSDDQQMEGQKLNNQSLVMGIEEGKNNPVNQDTEEILPSSLNTCPSTSSSSVSSPGTSPSGISASSQDGVLPQMAEYLMLIPTESSSTADYTFQEELSSDLYSYEMPASSSGQASSHLTHLNKESIECPSPSRPIAWLRNSMATLKNWSLRKKTKIHGAEEKKRGFLKRRTEPPPHAPGIPEARSLQEKQEEHEAVQAAECWSSYPSQDSEKHFSSSPNVVEDSMKLGMQPQEGESSGHCSSDTLPCAKTSACPSSE